MNSFTVTQKKGDLSIDAFVGCLGEDLLVLLHGGKEHIGAVGMAQPGPTLQDPSKTSSTSSVYTFPGHKEDIVAKEMAETLSKSLNKKVVVVAGMHWDGLRRPEIMEVLRIAKRLTVLIIREIMKQ